MNDCPNGDIRDLLPDLLHGRLDAGERAEVEAHLRDCELCREELALLRGMRAALRRAPAVDIDAIAASIPPYRAPARHVPTRSWGGWRIAAAVTLLAAGCTSVVVARHGTDTSTDSTRVVAVRSSDAASPAATVTSVTPTESPDATAATSSGTPAPRELALAGGSIGDLDDSELAALIDDIGSLNAVTPADVDNAAPVSPIAPTSPSGMND